jgi:hypothetical protein
MKKLVLLSIAAITFVSCTHDFGNYGEAYIDPSTLQDKDPNEVTKEDIQANVAAIFGTIDPEQDWNLINNGTVTITADANLDDIVKVQVLSESPYMNKDAKILAEANASRGETVTLSYDAPNASTRLIAACVSSTGQYFIKGFDITEQNISFNTSSRARTRAVSDYPALSNIRLEYKNSMQSYNAKRTIFANDAYATNNEEKISQVISYNIGPWKDSKWENERLWMFSQIESGSTTWPIVERTFQHAIDPITDEEAKGLQDIFGTYLVHENINGRRTDNMENVRNSNVFTMYNNHLIANGEPVIVTPVQMASSTISNCWLFYYYYNPDDLANSGMTEQDYIKTLPKFKAIHCKTAKEESGASNDPKKFFKVYEYLLPYFGDPKNLINVAASNDTWCTTDGKYYRIRNEEICKNEYYYMTYCGEVDKNSNKLDTRYDDSADNVADQLWQIFNTPTGRVLLYNVGSGLYIRPDGDFATYLGYDLNKAKNGAYIMEQFDGYIRFWRNNSWDESKKSYTYCLGTDLNVKDSKRISTNKTVNDKNRSKWTLEVYTGSKNIEGLADFIWESKPFETNAESTIIPSGYRIGFMVRKGGNQSSDDIKNSSKGCIYGVSGMNREINQFPGHFGDAVTKYSMDIDDPRIAMFEANGKMYMTFEEGSDATFGDMILEVPSGVEQIPDEYGVQYFSYTMCFEDSPIADYDMNDVVLKFVRTDATHVKVSLVACGAYDELYLRGLNGSKLKEDQEIHAIFGVPTKTFVNTNGSTTIDPIEEIFEIGASTRLSDFIETIYVYDKTKNCNINLSGSGDDPHAIVIPSDFEYPKEKTCINTAYPLFNNWAQNAESDRFWFKNAMEEYVYKK